MLRKLQDKIRKGRIAIRLGGLDMKQRKRKSTDPSIPAVYVINKTSAEGNDHELEQKISM